MREEAGVHMRYANFFFKHKLETHPGQLAEMEEIANTGVPGFRGDPALINDVVPTATTVSCILTAIQPPP